MTRQDKLEQLNPSEKKNLFFKEREKISQHDTIYDAVQRNIHHQFINIISYTALTTFSFVNNKFTPKITTTFLWLSVTVTLNRFLVGLNTRKTLLQLHLQSKAEFQAC
jgi:hypothetical protein